MSSVAVKDEMIRTGVFDDTDIALTTHVHMVPVEKIFILGIRPVMATVRSVLRCGERLHMELLTHGMVSML